MASLFFARHAAANKEAVQPGKRNLSIGSDPVLLPPSTGVGSGSVQDKEKALLAEIIGKLNDLFDGELTDDDQLIYVNNVIKGNLLESEALQDSNLCPPHYECDALPTELKRLIPYLFSTSCPKALPAYRRISERPHHSE